MTTTSSTSNDRDRGTRGRFIRSRDESEVSLQPEVRCLPPGKSKWHRLAASSVPADRQLAALWTESCELIDYLSTDPSDGVREAVAVNPATSNDTLDMLCDDAVEMIAKSAQHSLGYELGPSSTGESAAGHREGNRKFYFQFIHLRLAV